MGLKEVAKWTFLHTTPVGMTINQTKMIRNTINKTVEGYKKEGTLKGANKGYLEGCKSNIKNELHDALENSPVTAVPYYVAKQDGLYEGKKDGYNKASAEYSEKIDNLEQSFSSQKKEFEREKDEYESIIDGYEEELNKKGI